MYHYLKRILITAAFFAVNSAIYIGCAADNQGNGQPQNLPVFSTATDGSPVLVTSEGAQIVAADLSAQLKIAPDALTEDTQITITKHDRSGYPEQGYLASSVFEFGPDGLTFLSPVVITLALDPGVTVANEPVLSVLIDGVWQPLADSEIVGGAIQGTTSHFSKYGVIVKWPPCPKERDRDNDGYGNGCGLGPDCNDDDSDNHFSCDSCVDEDQDGWYIGCDKYNKFHGPDCDDDDAFVWISCEACADSDGDGYYVDCDGYPDSVSDCNDEDGRNWISCETCVDADGDDFFRDCDSYPNEVSDCDDGDSSTFPGAAFNDSPTECMTDKDSDGYGDMYAILPISAGSDCYDKYSISPGTVACPTPGMALIPPGCFDMGDSFTEAQVHERPLHQVCISALYFDSHEVTNGEYGACVAAGKCVAPLESTSSSRTNYYGNPVYENYPVIWVSWSKASIYCNYMGKRLPTEAEWEYAARGGLSGYRFTNGDTISCADANYHSSSSFFYNTDLVNDRCVGDTTEVGDYPPNNYGLYDMMGNVFEWVNDSYSDTYYSISPLNNPTGPNRNDFRVLRGGGWASFPDGVRVSSRSNDFYTYSGGSFGFRCALSAQ